MSNGSFANNDVRGCHSLDHAVAKYLEGCFRREAETPTGNWGLLKVRQDTDVLVGDVDGAVPASSPPKFASVA